MPESLVDIRGATQTYSLPPEVECFAPVHEQGINNKRVSYRTSTLFIGTSLTVHLLSSIAISDIVLVVSILFKT